MVTFPVELPASATEEEVTQWLSVSGYTRVHGQRVVESATGSRKVLDVVADRFRIANAEKARAVEAIEASLKRGGGRVSVQVVTDAGDGPVWRFSTGLHSPESDMRYADPQPALFSFNSAYGALRDLPRLRPRDRRGPGPGDSRRAARRCATGRSSRCRRPPGRRSQDDLMRYAARAGIPRDTPWNAAHARPSSDWVIHGSPDWNGQWNKQWYGVMRFFELPGIEGLQDAHPRALVEVPQLHAVPNLRRRAPEDRIAAVAPRATRPMPTPCCSRSRASCRAAWTGTAPSWRRCRA